MHDFMKLRKQAIVDPATGADQRKSNVIIMKNIEVIVMSAFFLVANLYYSYNRHLTIYQCVRDWTGKIKGFSHLIRHLFSFTSIVPSLFDCMP